MMLCCNPFQEPLGNPKFELTAVASQDYLSSLTQTQQIHVSRDSHQIGETWCSYSRTSDAVNFTGCWTAEDVAGFIAFAF